MENGTILVEVKIGEHFFWLKMPGLLSSTWYRVMEMSSAASEVVTVICCGEENNEDSQETF